MNAVAKMTIIHLSRSCDALRAVSIADRSAPVFTRCFAFFMDMKLWRPQPLDTDPRANRQRPSAAVMMLAAAISRFSEPRQDAPPLDPSFLAKRARGRDFRGSQRPPAQASKPSRSFPPLHPTDLVRRKSYLR